MPRLYELSDEYQALIQTLDNEDSNESELKDRITEIKGKFNDKAENIGKLILSINADAEATKKEVERLSKRKSSLENKAGWLKSYLQQEMTVAELEKIEGDILTISLRKNPPSVKILNEKAIPQEYMRVIPESFKADKDDILLHFKVTGEVIPGVEIITDKRSLVIR